ncbi:MAG: SIS domain-containing protein [Bacteroidales bacterium]|jgi:D-sedoheptulose 7-phosphate isomerase|nr:SIS domain-containing protein [Bacteroidales bacterium]
MKRKIQLASFLDSYKLRLNNLFDSIDIDMLEAIIKSMINTFKNGKTMYIIGNGGSAATASHIQADFQFFVRYFTKFRPKVIALTDNVPLMTAISNDNSYEDVFYEQMKCMFTKGDLLLAISASGNSPNIIKAVEYARKLGGKSIAFCGFNGGKLKDIADLPLFTPNDDKDYGPIEDLHMILDHVLINFITQDKEFLSIGK